MSSPHERRPAEHFDRDERNRVRRRRRGGNGCASGAKRRGRVDAHGALTTQARSINTSFNLAAAGVYIVAATDDFVGMDTTTGAQAVNLPVAVTGRRLVIKNTALVAVVNACNVTPNGAETIDGIAALVALTGTQSITLLGRAGTGWYIV